MSNNFIDLVIGGPDMSGTSTQIADLIIFFQSSGQRVRDLRGTELEALFHAEKYVEYNNNLLSMQEYADKVEDPRPLLRQLGNYFVKFPGNPDYLRFASCVKNENSTYVNPNSADVWVMEEPTHRGAGLVCRLFDQKYRSFGAKLNLFAEALDHQAYRREEFFRFRKPLREAGKIIIRSRSEESACYQIKDERIFPNGPSMEEYLSMPGHQIAFANPPTHIWIVCGPAKSTLDMWLKLREQRGKGRTLDDFELDINRQLLVNDRYAGDWLEALYQKGCTMYGSTPPQIIKFNIYDTMDEIKQKMGDNMTKILKESGRI